MTEHRCEWRMIRDWTGGIVAKCDVIGCDKTKRLMEVNRILNEHETLKRATDVLSAEDAGAAAGDSYMENEYGNRPYWVDKLLDYARILSPTDDISSTKER